MNRTMTKSKIHRATVTGATSAGSNVVPMRPT
jgi:aspartate 1-decarboxylase